MALSNSDISPELQLWQKVRGGSEESFDRLFQLYADFLYNYGIKLGADSALTEDCIQDFFIYIWQKKQDIHIKDSPKFYFLRSFRRMLLKKIRAQKKKTLRLIKAEDYPFHLQFSQETIWIQKEAREASKQKVKQAIDSLSPRQKEAIYLRYYENFANEEIAEIMGISIGSLYKLISAGIKKLKKEL